MAEGEVSSGSWSASAAKIDSPFEFEEQRVQFVRGWVTFETRFLGGPRAKVRHGHAMLGLAVRYLTADQTVSFFSRENLRPRATGEDEVRTDHRNLIFARQQRQHVVFVF